MQLPTSPERRPVPLTPLWSKVVRSRTLPTDLDIDLLYITIRDRLRDPEWEVRLHALRVLADLIPLTKKSLAFPFDDVVDNLGHNSPTVRKASLDALKVFCLHCDDPKGAVCALADKCSYENLRNSLDLGAKSNIITGIILSFPSIMGILKRRNIRVDPYPIFITLGCKLFDSDHKDVALRSMMKFRRICGTQDYNELIARLDPDVQDRYKMLCDMYDEDSFDVCYGFRKKTDFNSVKVNPLSLDVFSERSPLSSHIQHNLSCKELNVSKAGKEISKSKIGKVIIETEITFDSDTAITMTVLEENETEQDSEINCTSEDEYDSASSDRKILTFGDEFEDSDVITSIGKRVRFGGEIIKMRTPDSDNVTTSEEDIKKYIDSENLKINTTSRQFQVQQSPMENKAKNLKVYGSKSLKKSNIPLPVLKTRNKIEKAGNSYTKLVKTKSKSLSELYDYFRSKTVVHVNDYAYKSGFALTLTEAINPDPIPSPVLAHREVEVLHNLQRSPIVSPKRKQPPLELDKATYPLTVSLLTPDVEVSPRIPEVTLKPRYEWETLSPLPEKAIEHLHNIENWIGVVKAADQLHNSLLDPRNLRTLEPEAPSLVEHMLALSTTVPGAQGPAEGIIAVLVRGCSPLAVRRILPLLVGRLGQEPPPTALPHALLSRLALHQVIEFIFDEEYLGTSDVQSQLRAALSLAHAAGPAAVLAAIRRRLGGTATSQQFCDLLREQLTQPGHYEHARPLLVPRGSQLPVLVRRRARSTPPPAPRTRRLLPIGGLTPLSAQTDTELLKKAPLAKLTNIKDTSASKDDKGAEILKELSADKPPLQTIIVEPVKPSTPTSIHSNKNDLIAKDSVDSDSEQEAQENDDYVDNQENDDYLDSQEDDLKEPSIKSEISNRTITLSSHDSRDKTTASQKSTPSDNSPNQSQYPSKSVSPVKSRCSTPETVAIASNRSGSITPLSNSISRHSSPAGTSNTSPFRSTVSSPVRVRINDDVKVILLDHNVKRILADCIAPPKHEDWESIIKGLTEIEILAMDPTAKAPASSWREVTRTVATHVKSLRSKVARAACRTLGILFQHRGKTLDPETEEAAGALLERAADVNRFIRADAVEGLCRVAVGASAARVTAAMVRRGATHRAGAVRAAAAQALTEMVTRGGATRALDLPHEPRTLLLRTAGDLLGDASPDARAHARKLCACLSEDPRFHPMLKDSMAVGKYRSIEKHLESLHCR